MASFAASLLASLPSRQIRPMDDLSARASRVEVELIEFDPQNPHLVELEVVFACARPLFIEAVLVRRTGETDVFVTFNRLEGIPRVEAASDEPVVMALRFPTALALLESPIFDVEVVPLFGPRQMFPRIQSLRKPTPDVHREAYRRGLVESAAAWALIGAGDAAALAAPLRALDALVGFYHPNGPLLVSDVLMSSASLSTSRPWTADLLSSRPASDPPLTSLPTAAPMAVSDEDFAGILSQCSEVFDKIEGALVDPHPHFLTRTEFVTHLRLGLLSTAMAVNLAILIVAGVFSGGVASGAIVGVEAAALGTSLAAIGVTAMQFAYRVLSGKEQQAALRYDAMVRTALEYTKDQAPADPRDTSRALEVRLVMALCNDPSKSDVRVESGMVVYPDFAELASRVQRFANGNPFSLIYESRCKFALFCTAVVAIHCIRSYFARMRIVATVGGQNAGKSTLVKLILQHFGRIEEAAAVETGFDKHTSTVRAYRLRPSLFLLDTPGADQARRWDSVLHFLPAVDVVVCLQHAAQGATRDMAEQLKTLLNRHPSKVLFLFNQADMLGDALEAGNVPAMLQREFAQVRSLVAPLVVREDCAHYSTLKRVPIALNARNSVLGPDEVLRLFLSLVPTTAGPQSI